MQTSSPETLLVCEHCDTVYRRHALTKGEEAMCLRCGHVLERHSGLGPHKLLALVLAAMILFLMANAWPIVTLGLNGRLNSATLWGTIIAMWQQGAQVISVLAALTLFFFPMMKMLSIGWLMWFARNGRRAPGFRSLMIGLHYLGPWTMSEVFVLGALVAIVKARVYFEVQADPGMYAYAGLTLMITVFAGVDLHRLWDLTWEPAA